MLHLEAGIYFGLNPVGTCVWEHLEQGATVAELVDCVRARFDVDVSTARRDLEELLAQLEGRGLAVRER